MSYLEKIDLLGVTSWDNISWWFQSWPINKGYYLIWKPAPRKKRRGMVRSSYQFYTIDPIPSTSNIINCLLGFTLSGVFVLYNGCLRCFLRMPSSVFICDIDSLATLSDHLYQTLLVLRRWSKIPTKSSPTNNFWSTPILAPLFRRAVWVYGSKGCKVWFWLFVFSISF